MLLIITLPRPLTQIRAAQNFLRFAGMSFCILPAHLKQPVPATAGYLRDFLLCRAPLLQMWAPLRRLSPAPSASGWSKGFDRPPEALKGLSWLMRGGDPASLRQNLPVLVSYIVSVLCLMNLVLRLLCQEFASPGVLACNGVLIFKSSAEAF